MYNLSRLIELDLHDLSEAMQCGELTAVALTEHHLDRIARHNGTYNAFVHVDTDGAIQAAHASDQRRSAGRSLGRLDGIPFAVKDTFDVAGMPATSGSARNAGRVATETALSVARLIDAGGICLGKLTTWEYGTGNGGISFDLPNPPALNPRNLGRFAAGSSTGSGVAVAAGFVVFAIGSDTGGSVRLPAASCGIVALKPANHVIPTHGITTNCRTFDVPGPLTRSPRDAALIAVTMANLPLQEPTTGAMRIGVPRLDVQVDPRILAGVTSAADTLRAMGHTIESCTMPLPLTQYRSITGIINNGECAREHPSLSDDPRIG